jgi:hypothetical protein
VKAEPIAPPRARRPGSMLASFVTLAMGALWASGCAAGGGMTADVPTPMGNLSTSKPSPDPRVGLAAGRENPGQASWNMQLISNAPTPREFEGKTNSDLAFLGNYLFQGNYDGFMIWDVGNPMRPRLVKPYVCPASQSDVSVFQNLLFVSSESTSGGWTVVRKGWTTPSARCVSGGSGSSTSPTSRIPGTSTTSRPAGAPTPTPW